MDRLDHLLVTLSEECAEVSQRCTKALRFGLNETQLEHTEDNALRLENELSDLLAIMDLLILEGHINDPNTFSKKVAKQERFEKYLERSKEMSRYESEP